MAMRWDEAITRLPDDRPVTGVEIGVWRGEMSDHLLSARPLLTLHLVDPWTDESQGSRMTGICPPDEAMELVLQVCRRRQNRGVMHRMTSVEASRQFSSGSLDFAFIDGRHNYRSVKEDIASWRDKVRGGGWVGGHDYHPDRYPGCIQAIHEAFGDRVELGDDWTWFVWI